MLDAKNFKPKARILAGLGPTLLLFPLSLPLPLLLPLFAAAADAPPAWEAPGKNPGVAAESDFFRDRMQEPQNHFLLNGREGFIAGAEFYQQNGESAPLLWSSHPFLRYGTDRSWQNDTTALSVRAQGGNEISGEPTSPYAYGEMGWRVLEGLRLHGGLDQNGLYSQSTLADRQSRIRADRKGKAELAWIGSDLPIKSQANIGASFERRGGTLAAQYNQGGWWTTSPVSGLAYPWTGFNADFSYKAGEDFDLTLVEQQWDSPSPYQFYRAHWRRSEINMSFLGSSEGAWLWRLDIGYQRRALSSQGAFADFVEKTYPFRFKYRQDWSAPDSLPFRMLSQGSFGYRDGLFQVSHGSEFRETVGAHQPMQFLRAYYRHPFKSYVVPSEQLTSDSTFTAESHPGQQSRGFAAGAEYREVRAHFLVGVSGEYAMEWELPIFALGRLDTLNGLTRRQGSYQGSDYFLQNAGGKIFASGEWGNANWRGQAGLRRFFGEDADDIEFLPSPWWISGGGGWTFPGKTRLDAQVAYLGPKEIRGWGPVFKVESHVENNISLAQPLFSDRLRLTASALHAFGTDLREQPNGNPMRFRVMAGIEGTLY
ncbi:MAG: hypothetical protein ABI036_10345 [Fibrobacteria bacterium]